MGSTFGLSTDPQSGSGAVSSVVRSKFNHLKEILARLLVNWSTDSDLCTLSHMIEIVPGTMIIWPGPQILPGYIDANGVPQLRTAQPRMYLNYRDPATGLDTWPGGNGVTTFGIPNCYSASPMGAGQASGFTNRVLGTRIGEEAHANTEAENGPHGHGISYWAPGAGFTSLGEGPHATVNIGGTQSSGSGIPHNTTHACFVVRFLIKAG